MRLFDQSSTGSGKQDNTEITYFIYGIALFKLVSWAALCCWCNYRNRNQNHAAQPDPEEAQALPATENHENTSLEVPYRQL